jgi:hypothetical protein
MRAQVRRVGAAFEYLEKNILVGVTYKGEVFKERGLKDEWLEFMKKKHKEMLDGLQKALDEKLPVFDGNPGVDTNVKRRDFGSIFRRADTPPNCGLEKDPKKMEKRIQLLKDFKSNTLKAIDSTLVIPAI